MKKIKLFCDGSVNPQKNIGFGAYLIVDEISKLEFLKDKIKIKRFDNTSSTKLEIQTLIWALESLNEENILIEVYTDCQNIISLLERKNKLEMLNFYSQSGKILNNAQLYKEFFTIIEKYKCHFIKIKGHKKNDLKDNIDKIFNLVDKASRKALRNSLKEIL